jgi:DNA polymerase-3 subunit delta
MKLGYTQLIPHLLKHLSPIYLISGDELLLVQEAVDAIRASAIKAGFTEQVRVSLDSPNDLAQSIYTQSHSLSLFANKKIIEINLSHIKFNSTVGKVLADYALNPVTDIVLIIRTAKLDAKTEKIMWYQTIEKKGVVIPIWPITKEQLPQWIIQRAQKTGLQLTRDGAARLAVLVENNLLAAAQEIEKLYLLSTNKQLDHQAIEEAVTDHARFDIFNLVDSALIGSAERSLHILRNLLREGVEPTIVLWALTRELRVLADMHAQLQKHITLPVIFNKARIWEKRQAGFRAFLQRHTLYQCWQLLSSAAHIDRIIKGIEVGNTWTELEMLTLHIAKRV